MSFIAEMRVQLPSKSHVMLCCCTGCTSSRSASGIGRPSTRQHAAASTGQSLFGGFGAASAPASAAPGSAFNFAGSTGGGLFGAAPASSPGLFGGAGAFGTSNTPTSQPSRKGKGRK